MEQVKPINPNEIHAIMMDKGKISETFISSFKNLVIEYINNQIIKCDWWHDDNTTAEIPFSLWHENFDNKLLSKHAYSVFPEIEKHYQDSGWHTFTSTGAHKMWYITLTPQHIWDKKQKENQ